MPSKQSVGGTGLASGRGRGLVEEELFFSSRRRHTRYWRDWSSDVCSSDLPSTCTWPTPTASRVSSTASVRAATVGRRASAGDRPTPGRSTLMTSKRSASRSATAVKSRRELPMPCSSRSGSPEPVRGKDSDGIRSEEHTSELQSRQYLVCRLLLEKKKKLRSLRLLSVSGIVMLVRMFLLLINFLKAYHSFMNRLLVI